MKAEEINKVINHICDKIGVGIIYLEFLIISMCAVIIISSNER